jgi:hypothetical protein
MKMWLKIPAITAHVSRVILMSPMRLAHESTKSKWGRAKKTKKLHPLSTKFHQNFLQHPNTSHLSSPPFPDFAFTQWPPLLQWTLCEDNAFSHTQRWTKKEGGWKFLEDFCFVLFFVFLTTSQSFRVIVDYSYCGYILIQLISFIWNIYINCCNSQ